MISDTMGPVGNVTPAVPPGASVWHQINRLCKLTPISTVYDSTLNVPPAPDAHCGFPVT